MTVAEIMTRDVVFCRKDTDIAEAMRQMLDKRVGTLPVVDAHGRVAGMLTDRDIAAAAATRHRNAAHIAVHEAMSAHVRVCAPDDDVASALTKMEEPRVRRLPVVDAGGRLIGIVSFDDVVQRAVDRPGGVTAVALVAALTRICSRPSVEPVMNFDETYVGG
jgi:CBS domain-containing protein